MEAVNIDYNVLKRRDLANFLKLRTATPGDDFAVGELLVKTFRETYEKKLPSTITTEERVAELRDVASRRQNGFVRVLDFGYRIIGSYSLIHPESMLNEAWTYNTATLRCLAIDPEFHSLSLSERFLRDAKNLAQIWKVNQICLHVQSGAHGVAKLYERFGFMRAKEGDKVSFGSALEAYLLPLSVSIETS